jgi:hypothetical protein
VAISNFNNDELIEIFTRYIKTLSKHYSIDVFVSAEENDNIIGVASVAFFKELGRDIKVPLKKRLGVGAKLDTVYKIVVAQ